MRIVGEEKFSFYLLRFFGLSNDLINIKQINRRKNKFNFVSVGNQRRIRAEEKGVGSGTSKGGKIIHKNMERANLVNNLSCHAEKFK